MSAGVWRDGAGYTNDIACCSHRTIDLASLESWDEARQVLAGPGSQSPSVNCRDLFGDSHEG